MTHRYMQVVQVVTCDEGGAPRSITWRNQVYRVAEVFATWHLRDRWWLQPTSAQTEHTDRTQHADSAGPAHDTTLSATSMAASDRFYYRVHCTSGLQCDIYYDAASSAWVLDRVHD